MNSAPVCPQVLACKAEVDDIMPFVKAFHNLVRRRPFLVQRLEQVLTKLLTSAEFFDDDGRQKIAIGAALVLSLLTCCVHLREPALCAICIYADGGRCTYVPAHRCACHGACHGATFCRGCMVISRDAVQ